MFSGQEGSTRRPSLAIDSCAPTYVPEVKQIKPVRPHLPLMTCDSLAHSTDTLQRLTAVFGGTDAVDPAKPQNERMPSILQKSIQSRSIKTQQFTSDDSGACPPCTDKLGAKMAQLGLNPDFIAVQSSITKTSSDYELSSGGSRSLAAARFSHDEIRHVKISSGETTDFDDGAFKNDSMEKKRVRIMIPGAVLGRGLAKAVAAGWSSMDSQIRFSISPRNSNRSSGGSTCESRTGGKMFLLLLVSKITMFKNP